MRPPQMQQQQQQQQSTGGEDSGVAGDGSSMSSDDFSVASSSSSSSNVSDMETGEGNNSSSAPQQTITGFHASAGPIEQQQEDRAYWIQRTLREAIYGRVLFATVLRRRRPTQQNNPQGNNAISAEWEVTSEFCAVKEMSKDVIRKERHRLAEDPIKEVSAMQYLKQWHLWRRRQPDTLQYSKQAAMETHVMMPLDLLSDDRNLYSIMPYCDGGELFERLDMNERFSEDEARYWMHQVLTVSANLP